MRAPSLRLARADDFAAIAAITNHYIRTTAIHFAYEDVAVEDLLASWRKHGDVYPWLVHDDGGRVLAYAKAGLYRERTAYRWITETGIYVHHEHLARGLGRPLYARLLEVLRAQGYHSAVGGIALPNEPSVRLHERLGFVHFGTVARAGRKFDAWHDVGFWQLALQPAEHVPGDLLTPERAFAASAS